MTDEELRAWRAGLQWGDRVMMDLGHYKMVGTFRGDLPRLPDGERRLEVHWDFPDPFTGEWEDHVSERWLRPEPLPEPKPVKPRRRHRGRKAGAGQATA